MTSPKPIKQAKSPPVPKPEPGHAVQEAGGPKGKEPTRYGDWENKGICVDF